MQKTGDDVEIWQTAAEWRHNHPLLPIQIHGFIPADAFVTHWAGDGIGIWQTAAEGRQSHQLWMALLLCLLHLSRCVLTGGRRAG